MAGATESLLVAIGVIIVAAFFASLGFRFFRIPDIIFLIGLGVLLGPVAQFVDVGLFQSLSPIIGTIALIIILFEGGLKIRRDDLLGGATTGAALALIVFLATALLCALVANQVAGLAPPQSLLLGMSLGGAGAVIVIPLIQHMGVGQKAQTIVSIEAAVSDVFVILGVFGLATALNLSNEAQQDPTSLFVVHLAQTFSIGILVGVAAGFGWVSALKAFKERSYEYVLTIAILFLVYTLVEFLHGSGPLAVLAFGLVVGNSRKSQRLAAELKTSAAPRRGAGWEWTPVFGGELVHLHHEVVFFIRAFFFVTLGVTLDISLFADARILGIGALLALGVILGRFWGVKSLLGRSQLSNYDRNAITLMFPLGLAAAVVSLAPATRFDPPIPDTQNFGAYAVIVIVITNLLASLLVFVFSAPRFRNVPSAAAPTDAAHAAKATGRKRLPKKA